MIRSLAGMLGLRRPDGRRIAARIPDNERVYAIGDVHGRSDLLGALLDSIKTDAKGFNGKITLAGIGDYIDRGPDSKGVVETLLRDVPAEWNAVYLRGNHEQAMLDFLETAHLGMRHGARGEWLAWGGVQALDSYGVQPYGPRGMREIDALAAEFDVAMTEAGHKDFYNNTRLSFVCGDYLFVHAGVRRGIPADQQMAQDLLFIREDFLGKPHDLPFRVVFGHTILDEPLIEDDRIGLDTGAFQSGILTAVRLEADTVEVIQATEQEFSRR